MFCGLFWNIYYILFLLYIFYFKKKEGMNLREKEEG